MPITHTQPLLAKPLKSGGYSTHSFVNFPYSYKALMPLCDLFDWLRNSHGAFVYLSATLPAHLWNNNPKSGIMVG